MLCGEQEKPDLHTYLLHTRMGSCSHHTMTQELGPNTHPHTEENVPLFLKDCIRKLIQEVIHINIFTQQL